ncbi:family 10 glycosylhydrolase [Anaerolentibacter hominis]|uniref:family 10 glycosylhydrolase n=1 Tax=Anaerolentibacter hominis TaxID=3079009 RepID=UPI0031B863E8
MKRHSMKWLLLMALCIFTLLGQGKTADAAKKDTKKPTVKVTMSKETPTNKSIKITLKVTDASGISKVKWASGSRTASYFSKEGTTLKLSKSTASVTIKKNGTYTFYAKDKAGNVTTKKVTVSNIDKTVPEITIKANKTAYTNGSVKLTVTAGDADSGIKEVKYLTSKKDAAAVEKDGKVLNLKDGSGSVTVKKNAVYSFLATDKAGNQTLKTFQVKNIDKTEPVVNSADYTVMNQKGTLTIDAEDSDSGIAKLLLTPGTVDKATDKQWESAQDVTAGSAEITESGEYTILAEDEAGNTTLYPFQVQLELRAVWISYLEFSKNGYEEKAFKDKIDTMFDRVVDLNMNAVIVQVRPFSDALYQSEYYPWSRFVSGTQGVDPGYDPLEYMVEAAHERGLELHAWVNPFRVTDGGYMTYDDLSDDNQAKIWSEGKKTARNVLQYGGKHYLNPASADAQKLIINGIKEIVQNYDVDGIHMDDYFYPNLGTAYKSNFDATEYKAYQKECEEKGTAAKSIVNWRRGNINTLIKKIYKEIKDIDSSVVFGISPAGNIDNLYSNSSYYADVKTWMASSSYIDYICPQVYWDFSHSVCPYDETVDRWLSIRTSETVNVYIGIATYRAGEKSVGGEWATDTDQLKRQVLYGRGTGEVDGYMFFRYDSFNRTGTNAKKEVKNLLSVLD